MAIEQSEIISYEINVPPKFYKAVSYFSENYSKYDCLNALSKIAEESVVEISCNKRKYMVKILKQLEKKEKIEEKNKILVDEMKVCTIKLENEKIEEKIDFFKNVVSKIMILEYNAKVYEKIELQFYDGENWDKIKREYEKLNISRLVEASSFKRLTKSRDTKESSSTKAINSAINSDEEEKFKTWNRKKLDESLIYKNLICPYCNISYINYEAGYVEIDHIFDKSSYPALTYMPFNLLPACKNCNSKKNDKKINFTVSEIRELHENIYLKNRIEFSAVELEGEIKLDVDELKKQLDEDSNKSIYKRIDSIGFQMMLNTTDPNFEELKALKRYETLSPIILHIGKRIMNNKMEIKRIISEKRNWQKYPDDEIICYILENEVFKQLFDDWFSEIREEFEVLYYFRLSFIKFLLKLIIDQQRGNNEN